VHTRLSLASRTPRGEKPRLKPTAAVRDDVGNPVSQACNTAAPAELPIMDTCGGFASRFDLGPRTVRDDDWELAIVDREGHDTGAEI
jgi:hypothetical protein